MATRDVPSGVQTPDGRVVATGPLKVTFYRRGCIVSGFDYDGPRGGGKRGVIGDFSDKARYKFGWDLDNAPQPWGAMTLLSYRVQPPSPKVHLERFVRAVKREFGTVDYAWYMETQPREYSGGEPTTHFHWYWPGPWIDARLADGSDRVAVVGSGSTERIVLRGLLDDFVCRNWTSIVDDPSAKHASFQAGGRTEPIRSTSRAAWYPAAEAGKARQKTLPPGVRSLGRWCYISPGQRPIPQGEAELTEWPLDNPCRHVYDTAILGDVDWRVSGSLEPIPKARPRSPG